MDWKKKMSDMWAKTREGAEKAYDKGKAKAEQVQIELKMDGLAKKLGYLAFDAHRGRKVDEAAQTKLLADLTELEEALEKSKAEAAAKAEADKAAAGKK